jgi:hypothetical protein
MKKPHTLERENDKARPTIVLPKPDANFSGWGPRLRY